MNAGRAGMTAPLMSTERTRLGVACVRERTTPSSSGRDTLEDMRLMDRIFRTMILI